jgi:hypothetical protein
MLHDIPPERTASITINFSASIETLQRLEEEIRQAQRQFTGYIGAINNLGARLERATWSYDTFAQNTGRTRD